VSLLGNLRAPSGAACEGLQARLERLDGTDSGRGWPGRGLEFLVPSFRLIRSGSWASIASIQLLEMVEILEMPSPSQWTP
jgi:hypothetical protein